MIKLNTDEVAYSQIHSRGPEFSFVSKQLRQTHPFFTCKDYLNDHVWSEINDTAVSIYGFKNNPSAIAEDLKLGLDKTRILMVNKDDPEFSSKIASLSDMLTQVSKHLKLAAPKLHQLGKHKANGKEYSDVFYIEASKKWLVSTPMLSLFSLLMRVGLSHKPGDNFQDTIEKAAKKEIQLYSSNDSEYINTSRRGIDYILNNGYKIFGDMQKNYPAEASTSIIHNTGIVSFGHGSFSKNLFGHWPNVNS